MCVCVFQTWLLPQCNVGVKIRYKQRDTLQVKKIHLGGQYSGGMGDIDTATLGSPLTVAFKAVSIQKEKPFTFNLIKIKEKELMRQKGIDLNTSFREKRGKEIVRMKDEIESDDTKDIGESDLIKSLQLENLV